MYRLLIFEAMKAVPSKAVAETSSENAAPKPEKYLNDMVMIKRTRKNDPVTKKFRLRRWMLM